MKAAALATTGIEKRGSPAACHRMTMSPHTYAAGVRRISRPSQGKRGKVPQNNAQQNQLCEQTAHCYQQPRSEPNVWKSRTKRENPSSGVDPRELLLTCSAALQAATVGLMPALSCCCSLGVVARIRRARRFLPTTSALPRKEIASRGRTPEAFPRRCARRIVRSSRSQKVQQRTSRAGG